MSTTYINLENFKDRNPEVITSPKVEHANTSALDLQINGDHYKKAKIQPIEFIHANNIPFCEANVIKYIFRWKSKNGIADLQKAKHYIDLLMELESRECIKG
jgi:hypothetical protein